LELIHSNVCGLMKTTSRGGTWYFVTFTSWKKFMFIFWKRKERCLTNLRHTRPWWKLKLTWRSKPCDPIMEENLCPKNLMIFCVNVESNDKQLHLTHHNKMGLWNEPIGPSWSVLEAWFGHMDLT
jgi:hypothetical protein